MTLDTTTLIRSITAAITDTIKQAIAEEVSKYTQEIFTRLASTEANVQALYARIEDVSNPARSDADLKAMVQSIVEKNIDDAFDSHAASYCHDDFLTKDDLSSEIDDAMGDFDFANVIKDYFANNEFTATLRA